MWLTRVVSGAIAAGVVIAGIALWRLPAIRRVRRIAAALAAYGFVAFAQATISGTPLPDTLAGHGLFQVLPQVLQGTFIGALVVLPLGWIAAIVRAGIPRLREGSPRRHLYQAVALTACAALVFTSLPYERRDSLLTRPLSPAERASQLDRSLYAIEDGESDTPRDSWDPQFVVDRLGSDPQVLFSWVRDHTFWIPYRGVLRGPVGVLMDRQGNNLDRALLLATLLEKAGHEVRLAHGELDQQTAIDLLPALVAARSLDRARRTVQALSPEAGVEDVLAQYQLDRAAPMVAAQDDGLKRIAETLRTRTIEQTDRLLRVVEKPRPEAEWNKRLNAATAALRDHWWVQRRDGSAWVDLDLLAPAASTGSSLAAAKETTAVKDLVTDAYHEIAIRVIVEQWSPQGLSERTVLQHMVRPSDQIGQSIILDFWPTELLNPSPELEAPANWRATLLAQHKWTASLAIAGHNVGSTTLSDSGSDEGGQARGGPLGGLGSAIADALAGGTKRAPSSKGVLSAVRLEFDIRVPGEPVRTVRRTIFDLIGPAARGGSGVPALVLDDAKRLTRSARLSMETEILSLNSSLAPDYVTHLAAQYVLSNRDLLRDVATEDFVPGSERAQQQVKRVSAGLSRLMPLAATRLDWNRSAEHVFYDRPNVVTRHSYLKPKGDSLGVEEATDIVLNEVGVDLTASDAFSIRLEQGVVDTNAEQLLKIGEGHGNVGAAFAETRDWLSVTPAGRSGLQAISLSADTRKAISDDLDSGHAVVAPRTPVRDGGEDFVGWWRIDPVSGHTLGVAASGWGQELTEYEMGVIRLNLTVAFEFGLCQSFPQAVNFFKAVNDYYFGGWHPSWTTYTPHKKAAEVWNESKVMCVVQAIVSGFVATLPLLLLTLKYSRWGRAAEARALSALEPHAPPNRPPIPPPEPVGGPGSPKSPPKAPKQKGGSGSGSRSGRNGRGGPNSDPPPDPKKPPCDDGSAAGGAPKSVPAAPPYNYQGPQRLQHYSLEDIQQRIASAKAGQEAAAARLQTLKEEEEQALDALRHAESAYDAAAQNATRRGVYPVTSDPEVQKLNTEWYQASSKWELAKQEAFKGQVEFDKLVTREAYYERLLPADARLIQAEEQLDVALAQQRDLYDKWARNPKQYATCAPGSAEYNEVMAESREVQQALAQYQAALNEYWDAFLGRPGVRGPAAYSDTAWDLGPKAANPYGETHTQFPQTNVAPPPPPDNPMAKSIGGVAGGVDSFGSK